MKHVTFLLITGAIIYIVSRLILKEPIIPWGDKKNAKSNTQGFNQKKKSVKKSNSLSEEEALPFRELFSNIKSIDNHMIHHHDNTFTLIAEVDPVNYFLLDSDEQEGIDATFKTWLAQINYSVRIYLQNRFVDLTLPIT